MYSATLNESVTKIDVIISPPMQDDSIIYAFRCLWKYAFSIIQIL